jgi:predicted NBD/HSP70 family sugar kinase
LASQSALSSSSVVELDPRQREILRLLWSAGRLSRWELHRRMGVNPNAVGVDAAGLLNAGIIRECQSEVAGPGRPRIPLEIDPTVRHVVGLAISPGRVEAGRLSLRGTLLGRPIARAVTEPAKTVPVAQALLRETLSDQTLGVGLCVTGFVDPVERTILNSSSLVGQGAVSLAPLYETIGNRPLILENNMHALAAWWLLIHQAEANEDVLLVSIRDGQLGAALLIDGRPNRGCAIGANELGHVRFFTDTDVCYCGHPGCLERIVSTEFLRRRGVTNGTLFEHAARFSGETVNDGKTKGNGATAENAVGEVLDYLSAGLANAVNFIRPNRLVLASELTRYPVFNGALLRSIRSRLLGRLLERVRIDLWDQVDGHSAETAGWLALASLYREGWDRPVEVAASAATV